MIELDSTYIIAQSFGFIGMALAVWRLQFKNPRHILYADAPIALMWVGNYLLMGGLAGALINAIAAVRALGIIALPRKHQMAFIIAIVCVVWVVTAFQAQYWYDICPALGTSCIAFGLYLHDNRRILVRAILTHYLVWLSYAVIIGVPFIIATMLICIASNIIGMIRHENWFTKKTSLQAAE